MTVTQSQGRSLSSTILESNLSQNAAFQIVWLIVRVTVGLFMIHNGFSKLADVPGFATGVVQTIGFPYPVFFTYCAAYTEIVASILLALGFLTRFSAISLFFTMLVAIYFHLKSTGLKIGEYETATLYALHYLIFAIGGGGNFAIDTLLARWFDRK